MIHAPLLQRLSNSFRFVSIWFALLLLITAIAAPATRVYADDGTWVAGSMPVLSVGQALTQSPPLPKPCITSTYTYFTYGTSLSNIGHLVTATGCEMQNELGSFINTNPNNSSNYYEFIKPNTSIAFRVLRPIGRTAALVPVPNQASFLWMESSSDWGNPVVPHFYTSFADSGNFGPYSYGSGILSFDLAYELNTGGTVLTDSAGAKIYMNAYAFSQNGQWMVLEARGLGLLRVNTQTLQTQLFSQTYLAYNLGFAPSMTLAISDDGNSVIKSGYDASDAYVYDLSGCQHAPFTIGVNNSTAMVGCRSRYVQTSLQSQLSNFQYMRNMRYGGDGKSISAIAVSTGLNGIPLYSEVHYSVAGYQAPQVNYLALGDSFSSGEGAFHYVTGTDSTDPKNGCHLSKLSYPYLSAEALGIAAFHNVACSGARYDPDYAKSPEFEGTTSQSSLGDWLPGIKAQQDYVRGSGGPTAVTITMGGNDIDFAGKIATCLEFADDCFHFREDRQMVANEIYSKFDDLVNLYTDIKNKSGNENVKVYVLGYPQILGNDNCQLNVPFSLEERQMAQGLTSYLDAVIKAAAIKAGVQYIDTEHAFDGYRLCDEHTSTSKLDLGAAAVNGLIAGNDMPFGINIGPFDYTGPIGNGSFHPNALGHQKMADALLSQSQNFTRLMSPADPSVAPPYIGSDAYNNFIDDAPSANPPGVLLYTSPTTTVTRAALTAAGLAGRGSKLHLSESQLYLKSNSQFLVWFHSDPMFAGTLTADSQGHLSGDITIPDGLSPGYHTMHVIGKDIGGQDIDMYQTLYIAASMDDYNGDGVPNSQDPCLIVPASGIDQDRDGIDDACDGEIGPAPMDTTAPVVTGASDRQPDSNGWYNHDVTIHWAVADPEPSSGTPSQPAPTTVGQDGDTVYTSDPSCDPAGNCATGSMRIKLDKTAPDITFTVSPPANEKGWNSSTVAVTFQCLDATSGIESCTEPVTVSGDGTYVVTGSAVDRAGNSSGVNVIVSVDGTPPSVTSALNTPPNDNGWNNTAVTVTPTCSDALSGIAFCSQPETLDADGVNQVVMSEAIDNAGNETSHITTVNIDKTAPTVDNLQWSGNPKATTGPATLSIHASDNLSGVSRAEYFLGDADPGVGNGATLVSDGSNYVTTFGTDFPTGVYKVNVRVEDGAGNWSAVSSDYLVVYDPFSLRMTGKKTFVPTLANGDSLPWLATTGQTDTASFGFSVGYNPVGQVLPSNEFQFSYSTGTNCSNPNRAQNCHTFNLNATSIAWFTTQGVNNSEGVFEGDATLTIDGTRQSVIILVSGIDGDLVSSSAADHLTVQVFAPGANLSMSNPLYRVGGDIMRGNIHIKT